MLYSFVSLSFFSSRSSFLYRFFSPAIPAVFLLCIQPNLAISQSLLFHEPFTDAPSVSANGGVMANGEMNFVEGVIDSTADFSGSKIVCYPLLDKLELEAGTIQFWAKPLYSNHPGFVDIGSLGKANSWGIFINKSHFIFEVKNNRNRFSHAWIPAPLQFDNEWHLV